MTLRNINIIIGREYMTRVKKKSFILITFLTPILFALMCSLPTLIMIFGKDDAKTVAVSDESGIVAEALTDTELYKFRPVSVAELDSLKSNFGECEYDVLMAVSPLDSLNSVRVATYASKAVSVDFLTKIQDDVNAAVEDYRLDLLNLSGVKKTLEGIKSDVNIATYTIDDNGEAKLESAELKMILSMVLGMLVYMFIAMFSGMVMQTVIEEKSSRVVEVLVSSVKSTELMFGKIIGVACVALTQFFMWIVLTGVLLVGIMQFVGADKIASSSAEMTQMASIPGTDAVPGTDMMNPDAMIAASGMDGELGMMLSTLSELNYTQIILSFVVFFVLGYLLYASLFAAIGSAVENEADSTQLQLPVTLPLLIAFFIAFYAFKSPDSPIVFWGSMIPFTSPIVMLARIPLGVPTWEIVVSVMLLLLTFVLCAWLSARIYRVGILMFGKKTTFKDLWKWMKMK